MPVLALMLASLVFTSGYAAREHNDYHSQVLNIVLGWTLVVIAILLYFVENR